MSNINETQRKYLRARADALFTQKLGEIDNVFKMEATAWPDYNEKLAFINAELERAGLGFSMSSGQGYVVTPQDREHKIKVDANNVARLAKRKELKDQFNLVMDNIILGSDADELRAALESISNFVVTAP